MEYKPYPIYSSHKESVVPSIVGNAVDNYSSQTLGEIIKRRFEDGNKK